MPLQSQLGSFPEIDSSWMQAHIIAYSYYLIHSTEFRFETNKSSNLHDFESHTQFQRATDPQTVRGFTAASVPQNK